MAIVTLGELLHRKGGGAISAQSPLQVRQFDGSGNPISPATAAGQTATQQKIDDLATLVGALSAAAVTNPASNASVIAALKGILTDLGQINDAMVSAGATGSISAKLRRLTNDVDQLLSRLGQTSDAAADAGAAGSVHAKLRRLTADLAALKAEVDKLTGLIEDGALKTTLTGRVALLNALSASSSQTWRGWGTTVGVYAGTHPNPLDVSDYPRRLIHVRNNTNGQLTDVRLYMYGVAGEDPLAAESFPDIPAGATLVIDGTNSEIIDKPYPYISLRTIARNATEGAQYVTFFGGV